MKSTRARGFVVETLALASAPVVLVSCAQYLSDPTTSAYAVAGGLVALAVSGFATANTFGKIVADVDTARVTQSVDDSLTTIGSFVGRLTLKRQLHVKPQILKF